MKAFSLFNSTGKIQEIQFKKDFSGSYEDAFEILCKENIFNTDIIAEKSNQVGFFLKPKQTSLNY
jgi:hypothetical protein